MNATIEYYGYFLSDFRNSISDVVDCLLIVLVLVLIFLFSYRRYLVRRCNKKEYWLPIVDDGGHVIGRVARSISLENPGMYQHPLIRILTFKSGTIYLTPRTYEFCPDIGKYDHPFECMMEYGLSIEETIKGIQEEFFPESDPPRFVLRYKHENEIGQWQVLLYVLSIKDEEELIGLDKSQGRFWTVQQIQENLGKSCFSSFLEGEAEFLKTISGINLQ